jgi:hypothetical protein
MNIKFGRSLGAAHSKALKELTIRVGVEKSLGAVVDRGPPEFTPNLRRLLVSQSKLLAKDDLSSNTNSTVTETFMQNDFPTISQIWEPSRSAMGSFPGSIARRPSKPNSFFSCPDAILLLPEAT